MNVWNRIITFFHQRARLQPEPKVATSEAATTVPRLRYSRNDNSKTFKETNIAKAELESSWELFYLIYKFSVALLFIGYALLVISFLRTGVTLLSSSGLICQFVGIIFGSYLIGRACFLNVFLKYKLGAKDFEFSDVASQDDKFLCRSRQNRSTRRQQSMFQFGTSLGAYKAPTVSEVDTNLNPSESQPSVVSEVHPSPVKRSRQDHVESEYNKNTRRQPRMEGPISIDLKVKQPFMMGAVDRSLNPSTSQFLVVSEVHASPVKSTRQLHVESEVDTITKQTRVESSSSASRSMQQPLVSEVDTILNPSTSQLQVVSEVHASPVKSTRQLHAESEADTITKQTCVESPSSASLSMQQPLVSEVDTILNPSTSQLQVVSEVHTSPMKSTRQLHVESEADTISPSRVEGLSSASLSTQQPLASEVDTSLNPNTGQLRVCEVFSSSGKSTRKPDVRSEIDTHSDSGILQHHTVSQIDPNPTSFINQYGITVEEIKSERFSPPNVTIQPDPGCMIYPPYDLIECEKKPRSKCCLQ